ncbi:hypothetical protein [Apilactobacillus apinorum]|uniref:hypothetical protein n=1 Tax=Apilactobacillus apinorum TaxID=1218495 RepID=UPI0006B5A5B0|nr:hypothetical protein [Apilactobacillus apinorum]KOY68251.1 hypothetical protein RZ74_11810 [Apilactobacillus apinorum]CAI2691623.1 Hypothetical protein AAPFHON13_12790 [Apilactobacillus apinorum]
MKFRKTIVSLLAAVVVLATPAVAANAKALPNRNSNYWTQSRSIKTTRNITAYEHSVSNNTLSNTVLKKKTIKKGTALTVSRINNNHKEWLLSGIKSSNGAVWITKQNTTSWMKIYVDPAFSTRFVKTTKDIKIIAHKVVNNVIQSKVAKKATIKKGVTLYTRKLANNGGWIVFGSNVPNYNGAWVYTSTKSNWMNVQKVFATKFSTVDSANPTSSEYVDGYSSLALGSYTAGGTTIYPGDSLKVAKTSDSSQSLIVNGTTYNFNSNSSNPVATLTNTYLQNVTKDGKTTGRMIVAKYAPDDSRNVMVKGFQPVQGDEWLTIRSDHQSYDVYVYVPMINGWLFSNIYTPSNNQ